MPVPSDASTLAPLVACRIDGPLTARFLRFSAEQSARRLSDRRPDLGVLLSIEAMNDRDAGRYQRHALHVLYGQTLAGLNG